MKIIIPCLLLLFFYNVLTAQNIFKPAMLKTNPVKEDNVIGTVQSIKAHEIFLQKAIATHNDLYHLYGLIYLYKDYYKQPDFVTAAKYLIEAEKFVEVSGKPGWIGIVKGYRASLTGAIDNNPQLSIKQFMQALQKCALAKDSLCMGESYEQISTKYNELGDYKKANYYFQLGARLLRKYGTNQNMAAAYNNFANVKTNEKDFETAIVYIDSALSIAIKNKLVHSEMVFRASLSNNYLNLNQLDKALQIIDYCEPINKQNNWKDNLAYNYDCRYTIYERQGRYKEAFDYLNKYFNLKETILGESVKFKIVALEEKFKKEEYQLKLKKKELQLQKSQHKTQNYAWFGFLTLLVLFIGIWLWRKQNIHNKKEAKENRKNLNDLTNLLIQKNALLLEQEEEINKSEVNEVTSNEIEPALHNQRILTDSDWASFKEYFEKAYPNYISKLRKVHPTITGSEERLFLCIKLNLRTKETASMLGISNDSVKKNRSRLRKRLLLEAEQDLVDYIRLF